MIFPKADLHIHPFLKPYGHSYYENTNPGDASSSASPWFLDRDNIKDDAVENALGFSPYRQSDFTSCKKGNFKIVINSHYAIEQGFLEVKDTALMKAVDKLAGKALANAITEFGKDWITVIRKPGYNYYNDLVKQMDYCQLLSNKDVLNGVSKYKVLNTGSNIDDELLKGDLLVINSIEGAQALCNGNDPGENSQWDGIEDRISFIKQHPGRPFFITLAHHFYNGLCSHCESLFDLKSLIKGQELGMSTLQKPPISYNAEITTLGYTVIDSLLSVNNGPRILIDVKHMSEAARKEFYLYRKNKYPNVPMIYSHGACQKFYNHEINLSDNDILEIAASGGIMGIEMDQRILGYNDALKGKRFGRWVKNIFRGDEKQNKLWAKPVWDSVLYIAEACYVNGIKDDPWKFICIGSDYDGIINPVNEYRTIDRLGELFSTLKQYLDEYWNKGNTTIPRGTGGEVTDIIYKMGYDNLLQFIKKNFV